MARSSQTVNCSYHPEAPLIEDYRAGDMICPECGLVVGDRVVDVGSEWRTFSNEKSTSDPSRVGAAQDPLLAGGDLSTMIERVPLVPRNNSKSDGYPKYYNQSGLTGSDRSLMNGFKEIEIMTDRINLPRAIVERAKQLFKQVYEHFKSLKGRSSDAVASACLYIACRQESVPRTLKEICAASEVSAKKIYRYSKRLTKALKLSVDGTTATSLMPRLCANLRLPLDVQKAAMHIARKAVELELVPDRCPRSVAAAAIYMASKASGEKKTQKEIGDIAGVAEVTIRRSYKLMCPRTDELFPSDVKLTTPVDKLHLV
ncbi:hypothetical protein ACROYT_G002785 [Oculina patagonica]